MPMTIKAKAAVARESPTEPPRLILPAMVIVVADERIDSRSTVPKGIQFACSGVTGRGVNSCELLFPVLGEGLLELQSGSL